MDISILPTIINPHALNDVNLDFLKIRKAALILRSLNHELRQRIIEIITDEGSCCVTVIYKKLNIEQSIVSQHLALLRKSGILKTMKEKKFIYYSVNQERLVSISKMVDKLLM